MKMPDAEIQTLLRCPRTRAELKRVDGDLRTGDGEFSYPVVDGIPVLVADDRSLFQVADFQDQSEDLPQAGAVERVARAIGRASPAIGSNTAAARNCARLVQELRAGGKGPFKLLIVGGRIAGEGTQALLDEPDIRALDTDVTFGPRTRVICDAHDLPFADGAFDAVLCQAVLEHVLDPQRVVDEIHRVLSPTGMVYSEVPFLQHVHEGAYDFTRYTQLGHRRLYRRFDAIDVGASGGPGMALAWAIRGYGHSWAGTSRAARWVTARLVGLLFFWLKYTDRRLAGTPAGFDSAAGTFFLGRRREDPVPDTQIVAQYRGACPSPSRVRPADAAL
jgi:uncharacterized protein YbaR (Trm112 family)